MPGHELGGHPHDPLASPQQVRFETPRQVPAVLDRPGPLGAEAVGPAHEGQVVLSWWPRSFCSQLTADFVDGYHGVGPLVGINP